MTNLSKELCEICGIEPKWIKYETETTDGCINLGSKKVYPDFEQPENFVKLLEIIHARMSIEGLLMCGLDSDSFVRGFSKLIIKFLNGELGYIETKINAVKQAIRAEEWKYEI